MRDSVKKDSEVQLIEQNIPMYQSKINTIQIVDEPTAKLANDLLLAINKAIRKLELRRKFFVAPLNEHVKDINNDFKSLTEPLKKALSALKDKMLDWQIAQRKKEEESNARINNKLSSFLEEPQETKVEKQRVVSSLGSSYTKKRWVFKIIDSDIVPNEFKKLDEVKINQAIRSAAKTIDGKNTCDLKITGLEIYQSEELELR